MRRRLLPKLLHRLLLLLVLFRCGLAGGLLLAPGVHLLVL